jgi:hypothetical protein
MLLLQLRAVTGWGTPSACARSNSTVVVHGAQDRLVHVSGRRLEMINATYVELERRAPPPPGFEALLDASPPSRTATARRPQQAHGRGGLAAAPHGERRGRARRTLTYDLGGGRR